MKDKIIEILKEEIPGADMWQDDYWFNERCKKIATRLAPCAPGV